jgi:hypothetical protein
LECSLTNGLLSVEFVRSFPNEPEMNTVVYLTQK